MNLSLENDLSKGESSLKFLKKPSPRRKQNLRFPLEKIRPYQDQLENHSIYGKVNPENLAFFMEHHVFAVWDFMCLAKYLQGKIAPTSSVWVPRKNFGRITRFINEIILAEESDEITLNGKTIHLSHFHMYCLAMAEVGGNLGPIKEFLNHLPKVGVYQALDLSSAPHPAKKFVHSTFETLKGQKSHVVASAFAWGRERIIPSMFRALLKNMPGASDKAPIFHIYLDRHIHLDDETHGPMALSMLETFIDNSPTYLEEAVEAAIIAIKSRIKFWDQLEIALSKIS